MFLADEMPFLAGSSAFDAFLLAIDVTDSLCHLAQPPSHQIEERRLASVVFSGTHGMSLLFVFHYKVHDGRREKEHQH